MTDESCALEGLDAARVTEGLSYAAYRYNRERAPEISPERWAAVFPEAADYEARYQVEK